MTDASENKAMSNTGEEEKEIKEYEGSGNEEEAEEEGSGAKHGGEGEKTEDGEAKAEAKAEAAGFAREEEPYKEGSGANQEGEGDKMEDVEAKEKPDVDMKKEAAAEADEDDKTKENNLGEAWWEKEDKKGDAQDKEWWEKEKEETKEKEGKEEKEEKEKGDGEEAEKKEPADGEEEKKEEEEEWKEVESEEEEGWVGCSKFDIGWESAAWLLEDDGKRIRKLEQLATVDVKVKDSGKLRIRLREGGNSGTLAWATECMRAMCAMHTGSDFDVYPLPKATMGSSSSSLRVVLDIPLACGKEAVKGRAGARLRDMAEKYGVVAAFAWEGQKPEVEDAEKTEAEKGIEEEAEWTVGMKVEAKFGASWCEATLVEVGVSIVKVKWGFDENEEQVVRANVKKIPDEVPDTLIIYGVDRRGKMEMELELLNMVERKAPGNSASKPRSPIDDPEVGWSIVALSDKPLVDDKSLGMFIGKGGSIKKQIIKTCGSGLEYIAEFAHIVGTEEQRKHTAGIIELLKSKDRSGIKKVPESIETLCSRVVVPKDAASGVMGSKRDNLNWIEDQTDTMAFTLIPQDDPTNSAWREKVELVKDMVIEVKFRGKWLEASVLEFDEAKADDDDETESRTVKIKWKSDDSEATVPFSCIREHLEGEAAETRQEREKLQEATTLVLIGTKSRRRLAELKILAAVETHSPGTLSQSILAEKYDLESQKLTDDQAKRCQEQAVAARMKTAATAANCVVEVIGLNLCFSGAKADCAKGKDYMRPLLVETPSATEVDEMDDSSYSNCLIPQDKAPNLTEEVVAEVEQEFETFIFFDDGASLAGIEDEVRIIICGHDESKRTEAVAKLQKLQEIPASKNESWDDSNDATKEESKDATQSWDKDDKKESWDDKKSSGETKEWEKKSWDDNKEKDKSSGGAKTSSWTGSEEKDPWKQSSPSWDEKKDPSKDQNAGWGKDSDRKQEGSWGKSDENKGWDKKDDAKSWDKKDDAKSWDKKDDAKSWDKKDDAKSWDKKDDAKTWEAKADPWKEKKEPEKSWSASSASWDQEPAVAAWGEKKDEWGEKKEEKKDWEEKKGWGEKRDWEQKKSWDEKAEKADVGDWKRSRSDKDDGNTWDKKETWDDKRKWEGAADSGNKKHKYEEPTRRDWVAERAASAGPKEPSMPPPSSGSARPSGVAKAPIGATARPAPGPRPSVGSSASASRGNAPWEDKDRTSAPKPKPSPAAKPAGKPVGRPASKRSDPLSVLNKIGFPDSLDEWEGVQDTVWENHAPLPPGWVRIWSRSQECEYYTRIEDNHSTFEFDEVS